MKPIDQYKSLSDFTTDLDNSPGEFVPFKIFGPKTPAQKGRSPEFHSITMLNYIYKNIENPDSIKGRSLYWAPFGEINLSGTRLSAGTNTYSAITSHSTGHNLFQGDVIHLDFDIGGDAPTRFGVIYSHSCEIPREKFVTVFPAYIESSIDKKMADAISNKNIQPANLKNVLQGWFSNENKRYLGLPPVTLNGNDERIIITLRAIEMIPTEKLPTKPVLRLTYRALTYLQLRISHFYVRDVQNSDETRDI